MIEIDGEVPALEGESCEGLWCQQFWHLGEVADEADVILIKIAGRWHELYFDGGVVHWRAHESGPGDAEASRQGVFRYPLVNLGQRYGLDGRRIVRCLLEETPEGETLSLELEEAGTLSFVNQGDRTRVLYRGI